MFYLFKCLLISYLNFILILFRFGSNGCKLNRRAIVKILYLRNLILYYERTE